MESRLGRGLDSLIARTVTPETSSSAEIRLTDIRANPDQPRRFMDEEALAGLAQSIERHGVLQPIVLRRVERGFEIVAGERRFRASRLAGKETIPATIIDSEGTKTLELALIENIQREDLGPLEESAAYEQLILQTGMTHHELAERVGKSRAAVSNSLRLLELPDGVKELVEESRLSAGQARALLSIKDPAEMLDLAREALKHGWSVREVERRVRSGQKKTKSKGRARGSGAAAEPDSHDPMRNRAHYEEQLRLIYGTKASIIEAAGRGEIRFTFYSTEDRDRLLHLLVTGDGGE